MELLHQIGHFSERQSRLSKLDRAHVAERRAHSLVAAPLNIRVDLVAQLVDGRVAPSVYRRRLERLAHRFDGGVAVGIALAGERVRDSEDLERLVDGHVVELGSPAGAECVYLEQGEHDRGEGCLRSAGLELDFGVAADRPFAFMMRVMRRLDATMPLFAKQKA